MMNKLSFTCNNGVNFGINKFNLLLPAEVGVGEVLALDVGREVVVVGGRWRLTGRHWNRGWDAVTTIGLMLRGRCPADGGRVGPGAGDGVAVHVGLTRGCSVAAVFGCASVVLLVAGQDLVLDELDDVRQGELFPTNPAGQGVSSHQFGVGCKQRKKKPFKFTFMQLDCKGFKFNIYKVHELSFAFEFWERGGSYKLEYFRHIFFTYNKTTNWTLSNKLKTISLFFTHNRAEVANTKAKLKYVAFLFWMVKMICCFIGWIKMRF